MTNEQKRIEEEQKQFEDTVKNAEQVWNDGMLWGCPMCGDTQATFMGFLGNKAYYRCRACAWDYSILSDPS